MVGRMPPIARSGAKANRFCFAQRECSPNRANPARAGSLRCAAGGKNAVQTERADRLLLHLFQHQIHHRGQAHAMLAGTRVPPPQLDEFFPVDEAPLRAAEFAELGWTEAEIWRERFFGHD